MAETVLMPKLGLTMTEGVVDEWYKKEGDAVKKGEAVCSISSEKLTQDIEAESDGVLLKIVVQAGETTPCITPIGYVGQAGEAIPDEKPASESAETPAENQPVAKPAAVAAPVAKAAEPVADGRPVFISKLAKRIAKEKGIDYRPITGTGGNGRITRRDVEKYIASGAAAAATSTSAAVSVSGGEGLSGMRKVIAKNMMQSLHSTAQVTLHRKVNINQLLEFRTELKGKLLDSVNPGMFSLNVFLLKAASLALKDVPQMNSSYDGQTYQQQDVVNIGVAVSLDEGLVVPVIGDVVHKTLSQLGEDFQGAVARAREGNFESPVKGTFTISNLGSEGIEYFTPIVNTPEVGILGVGSLSERLYLDKDGQVKVAKELPLSLTFDHQIVDGAPAAKFLSALAAYLESPYRLLV